MAIGRFAARRCWASQLPLLDNGPLRGAAPLHTDVLWYRCNYHVLLRGLSWRHKRKNLIIVPIGILIVRNCQLYNNTNPCECNRQGRNNQGPTPIPNQYKTEQIDQNVTENPLPAVHLVSVVCPHHNVVGNCSKCIVFKLKIPKKLNMAARKIQRARPISKAVQKGEDKSTAARAWVVP